MLLGSISENKAQYYPPNLDLLLIAHYHANNGSFINRRHSNLVVTEKRLELDKSPTHLVSMTMLLQKKKEKLPLFIRPWIIVDRFLFCLMT